MNKDPSAESSRSNELPKIVLHVGRHKTGTTAIQNFLSLNDAFLAKEYGVLYPKIGRDPRKNHHPLFRDLVTTGAPLDPTVIREILREAGSNHCHTVLLSSEMLTRHNLSDEQLKEVCAAFSDCEVRVVMYLRRQDGFLQSSYAELVKIGALKAPKKIGELNLGLDYCQFVNRYAAVFGKPSIVIRSYDAAMSNGLLDDFLSVLGIPSCKPFRQPRAGVNRRLPWRYLELIRHANRWSWTRELVMHRTLKRVVRSFSGQFPKFMDRPRPLTPDEEQFLMKRFKDSNDQLAEEYLGQKHLF